MRESPRGTCRSCGREFAKAGFSRHLAACPGRKPAGPTVPGFTLAIEPRYRGSPWFLFVEAPGSADLMDVDSFLRAIWLECCGHLSWFEDPEAPDEPGPWDEDDDQGWGWDEDYGLPGVPLDVLLSDLLSKGRWLAYTYDAGSSTELLIRVVEEREVSAGGPPIRILARNHAPAFACECGKPAVVVCSCCGDSREAWFCKKCSRRHDCGEDMMLPIVDSPRTGVCGYDGPSQEPGVPAAR